MSSQPEPTIQEAYLAKLIAMWHGQTPLYREPGGNQITVANSKGTRTGWSWELDRYVEGHWQEYLAAARAIIRHQAGE